MAHDMAALKRTLPLISNEKALHYPAGQAQRKRGARAMRMTRKAMGVVRGETPSPP